MNSPESKDVPTRLPVDQFKDEPFIEYPVGSAVVRHILKRVENPYRPRPEGLTIISPPHNGKTFLLRRSQSLLERKYPRSEQGPVRIPTVYVKAPVKASRRKFFISLCETVRVPAPVRMPIDLVAHRAFKAMSDAGVRVIFIDELHHLVAGTQKDCETLLDDIKVLGDDLGIPMICAGTARAFQVISRDEQYLSRFPPVELPLWSLDEQFVGLLRGLEERLGVASGALANQQVGELIWTLSEGLLGRIVRIVNDAKANADQDGSPNIQIDHINRAGFIDLPWSKRDLRRTGK